MHETMSRACYSPHDLVDQLRVRVDDSFESLASQGQDTRLAESPQANRVRSAVYETKLSSQLPLTQNRKAREAIVPGTFNHLDLAGQDNVQGVVCRAILKEEFII